MARRMMSPEIIIKSQIADNKELVYLNEILEKYGTVTFDGQVKTITLQIYNKIASDETQNSLNNDNGYLGNVVMNGSITITKNDGNIFIQGMLINMNDNSIISYLEIPGGSYENGIMLDSPNEFDLYVIRV